MSDWSRSIINVLSQSNVVNFQQMESSLILSTTHKDPVMRISYMMDKSEVKQLIEELTALHDQMIEP